MIDGCDEGFALYLYAYVKAKASTLSSTRKYSIDGNDQQSFCNNWRPTWGYAPYHQYLHEF